jgi:hypothetical protein
MRTEIKAILAQWNEQYETIGFSYKPVTQQFEQEVVDVLLDKKQKGSKSFEDVTPMLLKSSESEAVN